MSYTYQTGSNILRTAATRFDRWSIRTTWCWGLIHCWIRILYHNYKRGGLGTTGTVSCCNLGQDFRVYTVNLIWSTMKNPRVWVEVKPRTVRESLDVIQEVRVSTAKVGTKVDSNWFTFYKFLCTNWCYQLRATFSVLACARKAYFSFAFKLQLVIIMCVVV